LLGAAAVGAREVDWLEVLRDVEQVVGPTNEFAVGKLFQPPEYRLPTLQQPADYSPKAQQERARKALSLFIAQIGARSWDAKQYEGIKNGVLELGTLTGSELDMMTAQQAASDLLGGRSYLVAAAVCRLSSAVIAHEALAPLEFVRPPLAEAA